MKAYHQQLKHQNKHDKKSKETKCFFFLFFFFNCFTVYLFICLFDFDCGVSVICLYIETASEVPYAGVKPRGFCLLQEPEQNPTVWSISHLKVGPQALLARLHLEKKTYMFMKEIDS